MPALTKEKILLSLLIERNFDKRLAEYKEFINVLIKLTNNLHDAKVKIEYWKNYLEILLFKFAIQSSSLALLFEGTPLNNKELNLIGRFKDVATIFLIERALIENYLMFYYLYVQPKSQDISVFRTSLYELSGLAHRQKFASSFEQENQKKIEQVKINDLVTLIKNNNYFKSLDKQAQNSLLKEMPAREISWVKLIKESHLDSDIFSNLWRLYSNYAHSEFLGSNQLKAYLKNQAELNNSLFLSVENATIPLCVLIIDIVEMFKINRIIYNTLPLELTVKIDFWNKFGKGKLKDKYKRN